MNNLSILDINQFGNYNYNLSQDNKNKEKTIKPYDYNVLHVNTIDTKLRLHLMENYRIVLI